MELLNYPTEVPPLLSKVIQDCPALQKLVAFNGGFVPYVTTCNPMKLHMKLHVELPIYAMELPNYPTEVPPLLSKVIQDCLALLRTLCNYLQPL